MTRLLSSCHFYDAIILERLLFDCGNLLGEEGRVNKLPEIKNNPSTLFCTCFTIKK